MDSTMDCYLTMVTVFAADVEALKPTLPA